ncbi:MAG TPA: SemiSWEET transporter [Leptospiraceae bacterium]|nr:SemiSWEET transporter [Leptospiraceae bacterium]HMY65519.1 SemiSWEET transporter [Leptospiraceae bacterium]HMZ58039.1 SemiSWEET transporter [Leptospiraceae bacterium]HNF13734.1 SemiSWEET transporter [Leptospiraceae bacterium]HNF23873.1 SemiSWEET transporter [Leptospiraceae bacterium]
MEIIGYIGAALTTAAFLPQALRVIQTKQTRDISRNMYILLTAGICFWLVYGFMKNSVPILLANSVTLIFSVMILFYKLKEEK